MALQGFNSSFYLDAKLAALRSTNSEWATRDVAFLEDVLTANNLTAETHYTQFGQAEGLAPNENFHAGQYVSAKAKAMFDDPAGGFFSVAEAMDKFNELWTVDPYLHYLQFGSAEGINPSNSFDSSAYLQSKLDALQADAATSAAWAGKTTADVLSAFNAAGLSVVGHFEAFGRIEGIAVVAVTGDDVVDDTTQTPDGDNVFTLTTNADLITGTAGDDTINGLVATNPVNGNNQDTFATIDTVSGGGGNDTLVAQTLGATIGSKIDSVEQIDLTAFGTTTMNLANTSGMETFRNAGSIAQMTLSNSSTMFDLEVNGVTNQNTVVAYAAAATTGATDVQKLSVAGSTNDNSGVTTNVSFSDATIETFAVTAASGDNTLRLEDATTATKSLTIDGAGNLNVRFSDDASADADSVILKTIDASAATGNLTIDADSEFGVLDQTITTGTGDDTVTLGNVTKDDAIDLGDGDDTLATVFLADTVISTGPAFTNVETLSVVTVGVDVDANIKLDKAASLTKIVLGVDDGGDGDSVTITKAAAGLNTISYNGGGATTTDVVLDTLAFSYAVSTGTSDALTLDFMNVDASGNVIVPDAGTQLTAAVTANKIENITVNTAALGADTVTTTPATSDGGLALTFASTDSLKSLTLVSETLLDLNGSALDGMVSVIDASAANGGVLLDLSLITDESVTTFDSKVATITTGSGDDVLTGLFTTTAEVHTATVSLGAGNDALTVAGPVGDQAGAVDTLIIDAGAGNDTITLLNATIATQATVALTLGTGVDTLSVLGNATQTGITVNDFVVGAGGDKLDFSALTLTVGGAGSITDYAEVANGTDYTAGTIGGVTVYTANDLTALSGAALAVAAASVAGGGVGQALVHTAGDDYLVAASDGTDTGIFLVADGGDTVVDAGEVTLLVTLLGVENAAALTVDNFTDFLA